MLKNVYREQVHLVQRLLGFDEETSFRIAVMFKPVNVESTNKVKCVTTKVYLLQNNTTITMRGAAQSEASEENILYGSKVKTVCL